jgi:hypothetical protein
MFTLNVGQAPMKRNTIGVMIISAKERLQRVPLTPVPLMAASANASMTRQLLRAGTGAKTSHFHQ